MGRRAKLEAREGEVGSGSVTIEEFARWPKEDLYKTELVRGWIVREPRPMAPHARTVARLTYFLEAYAETSGQGVVLADMGFVVEPDAPTVRGPDIAYVSRARIPDTYAEGFWYFGPDLAIEVLSPSNRPGEMRQKMREYFAAGSREVWIVDPRRRRVTVYEPGGHSYMIASDGILRGGVVLPGFELQLPRLFSS